MSKEQELARSILQVASCVSIPLEERVEMIKATARALLKEMLEAKVPSVKELLDK
jgi:hypothetical protein